MYGKLTLRTSYIREIWVDISDFWRCTYGDTCGPSPIAVFFAHYG